MIPLQSRKIGAIYMVCKYMTNRNRKYFKVTIINRVEIIINLNIFRMFILAILDFLQ